MEIETDIAREVRQYCADIASNPLLVQAAGGNVSWKDGDRLWIKASGIWLANATKENIFVPVHLPPLKNALQSENFGFAAHAMEGHTLRPSIETLLHALMPQPVVVHLHPVNALTWLTREDCAAVLRERLQALPLDWALVDYQRPGEDLARAVQAALQAHCGAQVILLRNHGVILGAHSLAEVVRLSNLLEQALATEPRSLPRAVAADLQILTSSPYADAGYTPASDAAFHLLATDADLYHRVCHEWALCPDHVVFLGASAVCLRNAQPLPLAQDGEPAPAFVFVQNTGVLQHHNASPAQCAQLRFYLDVMLRQPKDAPSKILSAQQIAKLLNWDAEKYRISLNQTLSKAKP